MAVVLLVAACGGDDRPSDAEWRVEWERQRDLVPDADEFLAGGADLCGDLVGRFREDLPALQPTPTEALDGAVDDWTADAESIAFDCPDDRDELTERLEILDEIAVEVDAGLDADVDR